MKFKSIAICYLLISCSAVGLAVDVDRLMEEELRLGNGQSRYDAFHSQGLATNCNPEDEELIYAASAVPCPQDCADATFFINRPTCPNERLGADSWQNNPDFPIEPITSATPYVSLVPVEGRYYGSDGLLIVTRNRRGVDEKAHFWGYASTKKVKKVKIKVFKIERDNSAIGLPKKAWDKKPRLRYYAFEVKDFPTDEVPDATKLTEYQVEKSTVHTIRKYSGSFKMTDGKNPDGTDVTVTVHLGTNTQLFD